ncbi:MAG TPA: hypothetical protein VNK95_19805 [Caldilineaceae bacterium]|nr:hypothetical protein [Caldilineaceae bacterium]
MSMIGLRRIGYSLLLALLLVTILALTVYSQRETGQDDEAAAVQILEGGVSHRLPIAVTLVVPSDSGPQTVTVPLMLNLNLTIGPVDGLSMTVEAEQPLQFVSPLRVSEPLTETAEMTDTRAITDTEEITAGESVTE